MPEDTKDTVIWLDFEPEPDTTGDGEGDPDKYILTIALQSERPGSRGYDVVDQEEIAVIVHRTCGGKYPIDGDLANVKRWNAQIICDALNDDLTLGNRWITHLFNPLKDEGEVG